MKENGTSPRNGLILVIDDEADVRTSLRAFLEEDGYRVITTGDNDEALALLEARSAEIALIIQDCNRPLCRCLRGSPANAHPEAGIRFLKQILEKRFPDVPVIFLTGYSSRVSREVQAPVLSKPVERKELLAAVQRRVLPG